MKTIGVVVVTYNRLDKLKTALDYYEKQTYLPVYIIVVNNASADGTKEYLDTWKQDERKYKKYVFHNETNTGGSGGFYKGLEIAVNLSSAEWIWVADDDGYTDADAFSILNEYLETHDTACISAVCGKVTEHGRLAKGHRRNVYQKYYRIVEDRLSDEIYKSEFEINSFTYVGTAISLNKLKETGLPKKDYFIWYDDAEHSMRLSKVGKIICVPSICIEHDNQAAKKTNEIDWMQYYGIRNSYDFYKEFFPGYIVNFHFGVRLVKSLIKAIIKQDFRHFNLLKTALKDSRQGKFGVSDVYYPGMKG